MNLDGAPVERELLERMTGAMKGRAPDESGAWCWQNVGFGHAMLRISPESANEHQPCTLDGHVWITADARIDGRAELIAQLHSAGEDVRYDAPDVELILHAYSAFGESFLDRLVGDFAFALWDDRGKKLVCARDHFGLRPFFYARTDNVFLFASHIDALLSHPAITRVLDEAFIADFLLFGSCMEAGLSVYRDIHRLPAASHIVVRQKEFRVRRYWDLPSHDEVRYEKHSEYVDQFQELFDQAVGDRIRTNGVALELSGGMDSTSIAAVAAVDKHFTGRTLTAYTVTCQGLLPEDEEGHYAGMVASALGIPILYQASEDYVLFERFGTSELATAEPFPNPDLAMHYDKTLLITRDGGRVLLSGHGGDAVFSGSSTYYQNLLRSGQCVRFLAAVSRHVRHTGSFAGMGLRSALVGPSRHDAWRPPFPDWISPDFARRVQLKDRFESWWRAWNGDSDLYHQMKRPWLSQLFESYEALRMPVVVRHPFYDVRLVAFMCGVPNGAVAEKKIMRQAMRGKLPEQIRTRPKIPLVGDHLRARFSAESFQVATKAGLRKVDKVYVERERYVRAFERYLGGDGVETTWSSWGMITPIALDHWLHESD